MDIEKESIPEKYNEELINEMGWRLKRLREDYNGRLTVEAVRGTEYRKDMDFLAKHLEMYAAEVLDYVQPNRKEIEKRRERLGKYRGIKTADRIRGTKYRKDLVYLSKHLEKTEAQIFDEIFPEERKRMREERVEEIKVAEEIKKDEYVDEEMEEDYDIDVDMDMQYAKKYLDEEEAEIFEQISSHKEDEAYEDTNNMRDEEHSPPISDEEKNTYVRKEVYVNVRNKKEKIVNYDILKKAIEREISKRDEHKKMKELEEESSDIAYYLLGFLGLEGHVIDNRLEPDDRDFFYMMEEWKILKTGRKEVAIKKGQIWRIHYWKFNKDKIFEEPEEEKKENKWEIYDKIPDEIWKRK